MSTVKLTTASELAALSSASASTASSSAVAASALQPLYTATATASAASKTRLCNPVGHGPPQHTNDLERLHNENVTCSHRLVPFSCVCACSGQCVSCACVIGQELHNVRQSRSHCAISPNDWCAEVGRVRLDCTIVFFDDYPFRDCCNHYTVTYHQSKF